MHAYPARLGPRSRGGGGGGGLMPDAQEPVSHHPIQAAAPKDLDHSLTAHLAWCRLLLCRLLLLSRL